MLAAAEIAGKSKAVVPDAAVTDPGVAEWAANHAERPIAPGGPVPTRESVIEAAEKYLFHGLVEHDGNKVPLAENVVRREAEVVVFGEELPRCGVRGGARHDVTSLTASALAPV